MDKITPEQKQEAINIAANTGKLAAVRYLIELKDENNYKIFGLKEAKDYLEGITDRFPRYVDIYTVFTIGEITNFWKWFNSCDIDIENDQQFQDIFMEFFRKPSP